MFLSSSVLKSPSLSLSSSDSIRHPSLRLEHMMPVAPDNDIFQKQQQQTTKRTRLRPRRSRRSALRGQIRLRGLPPPRPRRRQTPRALRAARGDRRDRSRRFPPARRAVEGVVGVRCRGRCVQGAAEDEQGRAGPAAGHGGRQPPGIRSAIEEHREPTVDAVGRDRGVERFGRVRHLPDVRDNTGADNRVHLRDAGSVRLRYRGGGRRGDHDQPTQGE